MAAAPSDDDMTTCPLCHVTVASSSELQLHYLQSCPGYDNEVAHDPMQTKPVNYRPLATQQDFGSGYDRSSDRLIPSSKETTTDRSRAAVGGGDGNFSTLSQRLVKFVWFPNDPFKVHESKATLLSSFTAGEGSVELFKDKNDDVGSYSSSTVSVRIGKFDDGQIVIGEEMLQVEPYEVSNDSDEIYLITKEKDTPGPPPVNPKVTSGVPPTHGSDPFHGMSQPTVPTVPQSYGGDRSAVMGADMMGHQDFSRHGGRSAPSYSEDTGAAMQPHMNQNFGQQQQWQSSRQPAAGQLYGQHNSPPYKPPEQYSSAGVMMQHRLPAGESFPPSGDINTIEAMKKSSGVVPTGHRADDIVLQTAVAQERSSPTYMSGSPKQVILPNSPPSNSRISALSSDDASSQKPIQSTLDATPYGLYGSTARLVGAKSDHDFSGGSSGGTNLMGSRENDLGAQKPGINLQKLAGIEDAAAQDRVRALEEKLRRTEHERDEAKRSNERSNAILTNRIRRLEEQLTNINGGTSNENVMTEEIKKLNMKISELESTEHMMKESSTNQGEVERQYRQQLQELEKKCAEQKDHIASLEAICAMQQGESIQESQKELEQNKAVIAQLQAQSAKLQAELQECDMRYKQVASNLEDAHQKQTDLLQESRAAMTKSLQLTEENAKLHEQNFNLMEDVKSLKLQQQGGAVAGLPNDEELNALKKENARLQRDLKVQAENAERDQQMLEQKNYAVAAELQKLRDLQESGSAGGGGGLLEVEELKEEITKQKSTIQNLQMQQTSMEQEIAGLEEQNNSFQEQVVTLQSMKDELQQRINATEQEKAVLGEQLRLLQQSGGAGSTDSEVSSLRAQLNQVTMERDNIQKQMASTEHYKTLLEGESISQKATIATLKAQISAEKESAEGDGGSLQTKLTSTEEAMKKAMEESAAKDATITDLRTRMLELQQTRGQLENEVAEMRDQKEKMLVENAQLREVATQPTKYQHAVEENKQLKRDNQELGNALERAQAELQLFKENSMALKEQLDKATDQATLDAITDKMSKYKNERDDARAQVQTLQEQLHTQGSVGGASGDVVSKMSRYREERNEAIVQVQVKQAEITKLNAIIAQMASSQAAQPSAGIFNRQISEEQPSSLPSSHDDVFGSESDQHSPTSDVPSAQSSIQSSGKHSAKIKATTSHLTSPPSKITPSKMSPQSGKKLPTPSGTPGALKQPSKRTSKSAIKQVVVTASGKQTVACEPVGSFVDIKKEQRVVVSRTSSTEYGTVKAVNVSIAGKTGFIGVEMDLPSGTTDGIVKGVRHFTCQPKHAVFVPLKNIFKIVE